MDAVGIMRDEMITKNFDEKDTTTKETNIKHLTFTEWIKIIVVMINDVHDNIQQFSNMLKVYFLFLKISSYGCIFFFGMTFFVMEQYYYHTALVVGINVILFTFCYINEKINDISQALYNTAWYDLELQQQKDLLIALHCSSIHKGFTALDVHSLTLERFQLIIQAVYSNCIVLKKLINCVFKFFFLFDRENLSICFILKFTDFLFAKKAPRLFG